MRFSPSNLILAASLMVSIGSRQAGGQTAPSSAAKAVQHFEAKVRPLLVERCFPCHSASANPPKGDLRLDSRELALKGGKRGPALKVQPGEESLLLHAVQWQDEKLKMPPGGRLRPEEIAAVEKWLASGAPWPDDAAAKSGLVAGKSFWAYQPPRKPNTPVVKSKAWPRDPLDRFILAKLESKGLKPAPPADRRTLMRRMSFDLTGLPPTPEEMRTFLADRSPKAVETVVDRLLASTAFGERWGRHWLDVARYADSNGVDENLIYTQAWRYRDYVIRALNQDKPINRFIQEQVAGDLLPPGANPDDFDALIATGYLSLGPKMLAEDDPVKQELDIIDEQIDTMGKTFLGITLGCARCHDHKFDPFTLKDYYSLASIFKSTKTMMNFQNMAEWQEVPLAAKADRERLAEFEGRIKAAKQERNRFISVESERILKDAQVRIADYRTATQSFISRSAESSLLPPALMIQNASAPSGSILLEAEDFVRGNVIKDRGGFGEGIGVLVNKGEYPNFTEYEIEVGEAGVYQLDLRYASGDPRPIRVMVNGAVILPQAAGKVTGGFYPAQQKWLAEGILELGKGKNTLRFERDSYFPHIDKLLLFPRPGAKPTASLEGIAAEQKLNIVLLSELVSKAKSTKDPVASLELELPEKQERVLAHDRQEKVKQFDLQIAALEKDRPALPKAMAVTDGKPTDLKVHLRGNYLTLGDQCSRQFPDVLVQTGRPQISPASSGRLELAQWLTQPNHPLTSRVYVNRVWRWLFGKGIVASTDNFGSLGDRPVNQPLLDHLAVTFVEDGWSLKRLLKRIMLSSAYQMSSQYDERAAQIDPENRLQWRADRKRLEAEAIRDSILAVSGTLDRTMGGTLLTFKDRQYVTSTANSDPVNYTSQRRSVYLPVIRSALYDVYTAFDFGDPTVMNGDRSSTTVAPQSLFLMNSPLVLTATKAMAERLLKDPAEGDPSRVRQVYEVVFGRAPTAEEAGRAVRAVGAIRSAQVAAGAEAKTADLRAWQSLCKSLMASTEFIYLD